MMIATNAYPAELLEMQSTMNWPEFVLLSLAVLTLVVFAVVAPFVRRHRRMIVTDVLHK
ncbi:MAG TPA: hypothetical protein VHM91_10270 [Verrucomicrobiales bacterium]|nr:hypothetical protein [Verrucomicrobiales bacterium]